MQHLKNTATILLLIFAGSSSANHPPDGLTLQQWQNIKQQIASSKYHPQADSKGFYSAQNAAQGWQMQYATDGMTTVTNNDYRIGMKLKAIGRLAMDATPEIEVKDEILYYHHSPQVKEWWVNSADKVEQWFSIKQRPITGSHEVKVQIGLDTNTQVSQTDNQLTFTTQNGQSINYDKLKVWDSRGKVLPSRMQLADNHQSFELIVNDSLAKYPITIDPSFSQSKYLKPLVIDEYDYFGSSVAIEEDGDANSTADFPNKNSECAVAVYFYQADYCIDGTVNGLATTGLSLQNNGSDELSISNNGAFVSLNTLITTALT